MADKITIESGTILLETEEGQRIEHPESVLSEMLRLENTPPLGNRLLPDGVKFTEWRDPFFLVIHQYPAHVRRLLWIRENSPANYGPRARYRPVRLSLPYTIIFAMYYRRGESLYLTNGNELYFSNHPLTSRTDPLHYPALLNVSVIETPKRVRSWICTQHFTRPDDSDWTVQLDALLQHIWNGAFNRSSESHEGASWYGQSEGIHPDLHPVQKWEAATKKDSRFACSVPWKPVPLTAEKLVECLFEESFSQLTGALGRPENNGRSVSLTTRFMNFQWKR
jgi:hypothetical protein